ncbi:MAG: 30S ribosomal protein S12 methylthiotransferase RimO [Epsilonproteobacteria bacterium]|nr:30S ribosomal protein S12 methylthiotransferase RimO [Campylobacterota bacterium]
MSKRLHLISLGCNKNLVDSEVMLGKLKDYKIVNEPKDADVIIVNTCGFIEAAKAESINAILEAHNQRKKDSLLVVSGCLSQRYKDELIKELPEVDIFTGVGDYDRIDELISLKKSSFSPQVYLSSENSPRIITNSNYHAYIKLSEGCNQTCSFCAIPTFKGKLKSRTIDSIITEVCSLIEKGFKDFSFISQDSSSFGRDLGLKDALIDLIKQVELMPGIKSARILYLYPTTTSFELIDAISESPIFQNYFDIPIQHISNKMLKIMKRGLNREKTIKLLEYMKSKPNSFIRTAVIAGHPGEDERDFWELKEFLEEFEFDRVSVFEYSNEENTTAFNMKQLEPKIISQRASILGEVAKESMQKSLDKMVNKEIELIIEGVSKEHELLLSARDKRWAFEIDGEILINDSNGFDVKSGDYFRAKVTQIADSYPIATLLKKV